MNWLQIVTFLVTALQNSQLAQDVLQCAETNTSVTAIWQCVLSKIQAANLPQGTHDHAITEAAKKMAAAAGM